MMPAVWWSPTPEPGRAVKFGSCESATFMRNVPEPQRQRRMRSRKLRRQRVARDKPRVEQLRVDVRRHRAGLDRASILEHDAGGAPTLHENLAHGGIGLDLDAAAARGLSPSPA
jgi:hypothetical protein